MPYGRPVTIQWFERLAHAGLAIGWLGVFFNPGENFGYGGLAVFGFYLTAIVIALVFGVSRGRAGACRIFLTLTAALVIPPMLLMLQWLSPFTWIALTLMIVAMMLLWRPASTAWLQRNRSFGTEVSNRSVTRR